MEVVDVGYRRAHDNSIGINFAAAPWIPKRLLIPHVTKKSEKPRRAMTIIFLYTLRTRRHVLSFYLDHPQE